MQNKRYIYFILSLIYGGFLAIIFLVALTFHQPSGKAAASTLFAPVGQTGQAASDQYFVKPNGSGTDCTQSQPCQLSTAIDLAKDNDQLYLSAGTYTSTGYNVLTITHSIHVYGGWDGAASGDVVTDPSAYKSILDGENDRKVVYITGDITPSLKGLWILRGDAVAGAGIDVNQAHPVINDCVIAQNSAKSGAGINLYLADNAIIQNCQIYSNTATVGVGGGIYIYTSNHSTIENSQIYSNTATAGGGIMVKGSISVRIQGNQIYGNAAIPPTTSKGGGLYLQQNTYTLLENNLIQGNLGKFGGGVYLDKETESKITENLIQSNLAAYGSGCYLNDTTGSRIDIERNIITKNSAESLGAGLYLRGVASTQLTLTNNIISDNNITGTLFASGSGVYIKGFVPRFLHTTIARNTGGGGSGVVLSSAGAQFINTILVGHTTGIIVPSDCTATLQATLWGGGAWANTSDWSGAGTILTGTINIWGDPAFIDPDNGDYHIGRDSAAIDAGVDAGVLEDIDGDPRPLDSGFDIGADEHKCSHIIYLPLTLKNR